MGESTPGEIAYAAWRAAYYPGAAQRMAVPWAVCSPDYQAAWEAAAQAVLALVLPTPERPAVTDAVAAAQAVLALKEEEER